VAGFLKEINMQTVTYRVLRRIVVSGLIVAFGATAVNSQAYAARKSAAMAIDAQTGRILYSHNIDKPHAPASLTKVMTIYMLFEFLQAGRLDLSSQLQVTQHAANQQPSKLGLKVGQTISVENAIKALIVKSANDVAVTVAENIAGTEWKFAKLMTWKARQLGMNNTRFMNASGLPNSKQITTARDMITLSQRIQKDFPQYYPIFATRTYRHKKRLYKSYNRIPAYLKGVDGIKTGYTRASGYNLTSSIWSGRKHVIAVVLGGRTSRKRDAFMVRILKKSLRKASNGVRKKHMRIARRAKKAPKTVALHKTQKPILVAQAPIQQRKAPQMLGLGVPDPSTHKGPYHIQIGAFGNKEDAQKMLYSIGTKASTILQGHKSTTMLVPNNTVYRARFTGFSKQDAQQTCRQLKRKAIDCLAVPAN